MIRIAKYEFNSKEQAQEKIDALKVEVENIDGELELVAQHRHTIVELGNIVIEQGEYDEEGNEITAPVLSDKYHVDVLWNGSEIETVEEEAVLDEDGNVVTPAVTSIDHPYGWKTYAVDLDHEGVHGFLGISYLANKL